MTPQDFETLTGQNVVTVLAEIIGLEGRPTLTPEETFKWLGLGKNRRLRGPATRRDPERSCWRTDPVSCPRPSAVATRRGPSRCRSVGRCDRRLRRTTHLSGRLAREFTCATIARLAHSRQSSQPCWRTTRPTRPISATLCASCEITVVTFASSRPYPSSWRSTAASRHY